MRSINDVEYGSEKLFLYRGLTFEEKNYYVRIKK